MSVGFSKPRNPAHLPEHVLWTLTKGVGRAEARTRIVPIDDGRPELRIYIARREDGQLDLLWSEVMTDGRAVGEMAEKTKQDFLAKGWISIVG